jgi:predicted NBD/HSP70 family sugar kinase
MRIGIDFGGTNIKLGLFRKDGSEVAFRQFKLADLNRDDELLEN